MNRRSRRRPPRLSFGNENSTLGKRVAVHSAELRRLNYSLRIISGYILALLRANEDLLQTMLHASERDGAALHIWQGLAELRARHNSLTPREREVMDLVVKGLPNKQIAAQLGTAEITVKIQRGKVMKKMKAASIPDLVRMGENLRKGSAV